MPSRQSSLPAGYAREIVELCARFEVSESELLSGLGLAGEELTRPDARLSLASFAALVRRAERLTGEPGLAFHAGLHTRVSWHGFLGFAAMTAGTLGEALELAERFGRTRTDAVSLITHAQGDSVSIVLEEHVPLGELREFFVTALFLGLAIIGEALAGRPLEGSVDVTHDEPDYFPRFLRAVPALGSVRFGQTVNRIVITKEVLALPVVSADRTATRLAREQCERELAALGDGARVVGRLRALFRDVGFMGLPEAARELGVSTRTLKRRLAEQHTSFSNVLSDARRQHALVLLDDPRLTLDQIADRLGYSDVTNFSRAFRRWTGTSPGVARRR